MNHIDINKYNICDNDYNQLCNNCIHSIKTKLKKGIKPIPVSVKAVDNLTMNIELIKKIANANNLPYLGIIWLWLRESNWGCSYGARKDNVHFGVKCHGKKGVMYKDDCKEKKCCFVSYRNFDESLKDLIKFFKDNPRYEKAGLFKAKTAEEFVVALKKAGYATDPNFLKNFYVEYYKFKINEL